MKKYLLIFLLSLHFINAKAQAWIYHPMPGSNAVWRNQLTDILPNMTLCSNDYQYRLDGDTIFGSHSYTKVVKEMMDICGFFNYSWASYFMGGIRNDTANKKVYWNSGFAEYLFYDFSLNIGDSVLVSCLDTIAAIDSVFVGSNYRKRFITGHSNQIIEGIGFVGDNSAGINYADLFSCGGQTLSPYISFVCFSHNGVVYPASSFPCPLISEGIHEIQNQKLSISIVPSLFHSSATLSYNDKSDLMESILIYNPLGEIIKTYKSVLSSDLIIQGNEFTNDIYFIKVTTRNNKVFFSKFVVD